MADLTFLKTFKKNVAKMDNVSMEFSPPDFWYTTGCYALNRVLSGSYFKGIPGGRITGLVGPSSAGKSYLTCNIIREAQKTDTHVLVMDSENALDPDFMKRAGIDVTKLTYLQVVTIQDVTGVLSEFLTGYEKEYGRYNKEAPKVLIVLDSLGNCLTDSENEKFEKGIQTGDQGQSAKMKKHMLRTLVARLPRCNATFVMTDQVYPQDIMLGDGPWAITNGVKYSASQIALLTKLKLKEGDEFIGIKMRVETYKSRFVKPNTKIELQIPFKTGLAPHAGLLELWAADGIITGEAWKSVELDGKVRKFQKNDFTLDFAMEILTKHPSLVQNEKDFEEFQKTLTDEEAASFQEGA